MWTPLSPNRKKTGKMLCEVNNIVAGIKHCSYNDIKTMILELFVVTSPMISQRREIYSQTIAGFSQV